MTFKLIKQQDQSDCGVACLAMVLNHYGSTVPLFKLRDLSGTDKFGTSAYGLIECIRAFNFDADGFSGNKNTWHDPDMVYPAIAHLELDGGLMHYVVVYGVDGDNLLIADPAKGKSVESIESFDAKWSDVVLLMKPNENYQPVREKQKSLKQFLPLLKENKGLLVKIILASLIVTSLSIGTSFYFQGVIDNVLPQSNLSMLHMVSLGLVISYVVLAIFEWVRDKLLFKFGQGMSRSIMMKYYKHVIKLPMSFFSTRQTGDIISRFLDASKIVDALGSASLTLILDAGMLIVVGCVLFTQHKKLFLTTLLTVPFYLAAILLFVKAHNKANEEEMTANSQLNSNIIESINGIETIKASNGQKQIIDRIDDKFNDYINKSYKAGQLENTQQLVKRLISLVSNALTLWIGGKLVLQGELSLGQLMTYHALVVYFTEPLQNIINLQVKVQSASVASDRLNEVLSIDIEEIDEDSKDTLEAKEINVTDLDFKYGVNDNTLTDINFSVKAGEKIALVGQSGSGKSTLAKILVSYYNPESGDIKFTDKSIDLVDTGVLRNKVTYVPQEAFLLNDTLRYNLTLGQADKNFTDQDLYGVLDLVGLLDFVISHPLKLDMNIEENGANLSGGQKQRVALARALLKESDVYILDEATSAFDPLLEQEVLSRLMTLDKTIIFIAHHLPAINQCDQILVLDGGRIIESGNHTELIEADGFYKKLYESA